jgi:competence protein ComEA
MNGFIKSFTPLLKKLKKYLLEIILLTVALIITITALVIFVKNNQNSKEEIDTSLASPNPAKVGEGGSTKIFVDVSGAVKKPDVYEVSFGARLKDIIKIAGGLSDEADRVFFSRNFNLARIIADQEKIYIPSVWEINNGVFAQNQRILDYSLPAVVPTNTGTDTGSSEIPSQININSATVEELDTLPGIGQVTANKIIQNRPYSVIEELINKKVVNKSVYEKIKSQIITQ